MENRLRHCKDKKTISIDAYQCIICKGLFHPHVHCVSTYMIKWTATNDQWICNHHYIKCSGTNEIHKGKHVTMRVYDGENIMNLRNVDKRRLPDNENYSEFSPWKLHINLESEMLKKTYNG